MQEDKLAIFFSFIKLLTTLLVGFFLSNFLAFIVVLPFINFDLGLINLLLLHPKDYPELRTALMILQGITALGIFVLTPLFYIKFVDKSLSLSYLFKERAFYYFPLFFLTILLTIIEMPIVSWIGKWNEGLDFPAFMDEFETWAKVQEDKLRDLTLFLTEFHSFGDFLLGLVVIAILPGIGEELLFRGILQNKLKDWLGNIHVAVWVGAIIFSAFHFQFYGFVPRMLLGAIFGYLYVWSGSLWYPILAHFTNNGFTVLMMYLYQHRKVELNIDTQEIPIDLAMLSLVISITLVFLFYKISKDQSAIKGEKTIE
ncbi:MAG: CPBP family intramembrane metalloprotease [Thermoflexibacter sp.]|nr:CPBP family intramembrane metalloprotease [Thermoflexibacter sp.]